MSEAMMSEIAAREHQKEVDQDVQDMKDVNKGLDREIAVKRSGERMTRVFDMAAQLMGKEQFSVNVPVAHNGQQLNVEVTEYQKGKTRESGYGVSDKARIIIRDKTTGHVTYEAIVQKSHDSDGFTSAYLDHNYSKGSDNRERDDYKWRKSDEEGRKADFDATATLDKIPEMKDIENILQKALEVRQSATTEAKQAA